MDAICSIGSDDLHLPGVSAVVWWRDVNNNCIARPLEGQNASYIQ